MTDFGRRGGDMSKSVYDTDEDGVADNAETLEGQTLAQVQDHTPKTHTHTEAQITDLDHNAAKIVGVPVDDTDKGNTKVLAYNSTSQKLEYETQAAASPTYVDRGDPSTSDFEIGDLTSDNNWQDLDLSGIVAAGAVAVYLRALIQSAGVAAGVQFRENGNSNAHNIMYVKTMAAGNSNSASELVGLDANRKIEYKAEDVTWSTLRLIVRGWVV